ncbi:integral peroxisomal membrane peroxin-domain-containing protein [Protomyces lactucae-debilis]|uniref:Integral peroxisomal membrane peroxin-domain-containing protein n=1 Tax=Protomyces lactucae-debilis TaxID=2754530 RepID=A0A1Y2FMF6_PROLT|nr:integral peroxisomal membrane peroxin-domain-containing protein [Protomyces lactucae-debilis]ORY84777.1 integral peroxisomal membrane peroxin-domain-containing protein [Protomyces lactucae-debilis]
MAFEEMSGPRISTQKRAIYASFDSKSSPAGMTQHIQHPSADILKETPPSIVVALAQLAPIVSGLNTALGWITWTSEDHWSSFLMLVMWWLVVLYGEFVCRYAANWAVLVILGIGYLKKKTATKRVMRALEKGEEFEEPIGDAQRVIDATLYEIDVLRARFHLLGSHLEPIMSLFRWENPQRSSVIGLRLVFSTPIYLLLTWLLGPRAIILVVGTLLLTFTSPWFQTIRTVFWRFNTVRWAVSAILGLEQLPGEAEMLDKLSKSPVSVVFEPTVKPAIVTAGGSRFTTTLAVLENQRRWLGLGWTPSLLPHERAPFTDLDERTCPAPPNYGLPSAKTTIGEDGKARTVTWAWIDSTWRVEKGRGRDAEGWIYFDNAWRKPSAKEEYGKYTRKRKWIRNAECTESLESSETDTEVPEAVVHESSDSPSDSDSEVEVKVVEETLTVNAPGRTRSTSLLSQSTFDTIDPSKVLFSPSKARTGLLNGSDTGSTTSISEKFAREREKPVSLPKREWRSVPGGGKELVMVGETVTPQQAVKRPLFRRKTSRSSIQSAQSLD